MSEQRAFSSKRAGPGTAAEFREVVLDYVSGAKDDETVAWLSSRIGTESSVLSQASGKKIFRGIACYEEKLLEISGYQDWDMEANQRIASRLLHSAEFAPNTGGNFGICSTSTVKDIANLFAESRHEDHSYDGTASRKVVLNISIDGSNPPKGYVLDQNAPFGDDQVSLHEIQLSKHNTYRITGMNLSGPSDVSEIFILATAS
ncbi:hypothetical protein [Paraburkholderia aspalathi]|uniref:hypothetical protein n=1 Tax=Paraburkholderia aspalathi TaxID=1324617 RepID=UPI0038BB50C2